jgi:hypothetical protein
MPAIQLVTLEGAAVKAAEIQTAFALSLLRLFKEGFTPSQFTTRAELLANECDFDGYPAGGYALTAWEDPLVAGGGGYVITSPLTMIVYGPAGDPPTGNSVGGWWVEDAADAVRLVGTFDPVRSMTEVGDGFPLIIQDVEGRNLP